MGEPARYGRTLFGMAEAESMVGGRVAWDDKNHPGEGTIVGVTHTSNGYPMWLVDWDDDAPEWWSDVISPRASELKVIPPTP